MNLEDVSSEDIERINDIMDSHNYSNLKKTQKQAFENGIMSDGNHLLVAETGNGKTLCAEAVAKSYADRNMKVAYLVPSTQLVRDKKHSIEEWVDSSVEVSTGSGKFHHGDIVVATFSSFYQSILRGVGQVRSFDLAILDDFHELYGSFIGSGLEKSIAAAKQYDIDLFSMSATIGNPKEISSWLDSNMTVSDEKRTIPIDERIAESNHSSKKENVASFVRENQDKKPILIFNYAKSWTESRADAISEVVDFGGPEVSAHDKIRELVDGSLPESLSSLADMIENGVAYHHSSVPRRVREWIEDLYQDRKIECICATTTIAYGFDAPVQTVLVADMKRRGEWVGKWEYQQWIGRSARPGYGYKKGYAYVLTSDEYTVREEFFKPRDLEPIQTHIESPEEFRKLVLELIVMGWVTPDEIEEFIHQTLYWTQLSSEGAWGKSFETQNRRVRKKLRNTVDWLENRGFIRENRTSKEFESTEMGENTVEFIFKTNISPTLSDVYKLYNWIESTNDMGRLSLLGNICDIFSLGIRAKNCNEDISALLRDSGLAENGDTITAGAIHNNWIKNYSTEEIEERTGLNAAYLTSVCYRISSALKSSDEIIEPSAKRKPHWLESYSYRVQRGIKLDSVPYVRNVRGLGRSRVRALKQYLRSSNPNKTGKNENTKPLFLLLDELLADESEEEVSELISDNVSGIGNSISARLVEYHRDNYVAEKFKKQKQTGDKENYSIDNF